MSIREELFNLTFVYGEYVNDSEREQMTYKILKLFEKTVNEIITDCRYDTNIMGFVYRLRKSLE